MLGATREETAAVEDLQSNMQNTSHISRVIGNRATYLNRARVTPFFLKLYTYHIAIYNIYIYTSINVYRGAIWVAQFPRIARSRLWRVQCLFKPHHIRGQPISLYCGG